MRVFVVKEQMRAEFKRARVRVFGLTIGQLSAASRAALKRRSTWTQLAQGFNDPLSFVHEVTLVNMTRDKTELAKLLFARQH
ncbi:hypothetical protein FVE85_5004 [Porphyridium purpureum]|uniref:Uncharacterized protein n=1 Tax=Porphyridium purpureum TaxID=35688 RepID=A0A5J4YTX9_PORPP|nr:hypothetical protein FVE85_5004 [Porphyridium purpureum]|eukprot:POR8901..scf236_6